MRQERPNHTQDQAGQTKRGEPRSAKLNPGEHLGKYTIERKLGEGAMGAVYLALDTALNRQVALKTPFFTPGDDGEVIDRFYREARAMATLRHPNLCPVYEVNEIDGMHFLTMAFIEGRPLADFVRRKKRMPGRSVAAVMRKLALALFEAHQKGIVHRDLKPANIMVDLRNEPIVMDFGLARVRGGSEAELTLAGQILGSPAYMSPEQVEGDQRRIGPRSDVYSLGVIMYQMLTGRVPFEGSVGAVLGKIMSQEPARPSSLHGGIDSDLEAICLKAMSKDERQRYGTAEEFAEALWGFLKQRPVSGAAESSSATTQTRTPSRTLSSSVTPSGAANELHALTRELFDQLNAEEDRRGAARSRRNVLITTVGLLTGLMVFAAAGFAGWKLTDKGQVIIQSYDPHAAVVVTRDGRQVDEFEVMQRPVSTPYYAGAFEIAMKANQPVGATVRNGKFMLSRGQVVIVEIVPPDYRNVAMFAIEHRGLVFIVGEQQVAATIAQLPPGEFQIRRLELVSSNDQELRQLVDRMVEMRQAPDVRLVGPSPDITNAGLKELTRLPTLQWLGVSSASISDEGVAELANLPNLKTLELDNVPVGDKALAAISRMLGSLEKLVATQVQLTDDGLSQLKSLPNLETLEIDSQAVTNAGIKHFGEYPKLKSLRIRDNPNISAEGLQTLAQMQKLEHLSLEGSAIQDEHLKHLAKSKSLRELDLRRTPVSDAGMLALQGSQLEKLDLRETEVSERGAAYAQSTLVHCQIDSRFSPRGKSVGVARAANEAVEAKQRQQAYVREQNAPLEFLNSIGMKFRLLPPGTFRMGSPDSEIKLIAAALDAKSADLVRSEGPQCTVTLTQPFYMGTHEVTQAQFELVMNKNPSAEPRAPQFPVGMTPWTDAIDFCNKLSVLEKLKPCYERTNSTVRVLPDGNGYRLPTEAEWEYACRGGTNTAFYFADSATEIQEYSWAFQPKNAPQPGGQKLPNAYGLFDMYGNHWEWCEDLYDPNRYQAGDATDPRFCDGVGDRVSRGGANFHDAVRVRSAARLGQLATMTYPASGIRIVLPGSKPPQ